MDDLGLNGHPQIKIMGFDILITKNLGKIQITASDMPTSKIW